MKKVVLILMLVAAAGWGVFKLRGWKSASASTSDPARATTALAETGNIQFAVTVAGEISPAEQVSVRPQVNGLIAKLPVDVGDKVKKGDLLFTLDDHDIKIEIASRQADIDAAHLQLEKGERDFERDKKLFEENLISREVFDNTKTEYELAKNALERAERALDQSKDRLTYTRITAPFDCTILTRPVSAGQAVSGSGGFNSGTEVLTIADLNAMIINAHVNQADITRLKVGQQVEVAVEAIPGLTVRGVVERISPQATIKNNIKGFDARILLKNVDPRIQPGMTANITIPVASAENVLSIPLAAVFTELDPESEQPERFVYVKKGEQYERRSVRIGLTDYFHAEVLAGLKSGETVAIEKPSEDAIIKNSGDINSPTDAVAGTSPSNTGLSNFKKSKLAPAARRAGAGT